MPTSTAFAAWANEYGRARLARDLGVTWGAVNRWTKGTAQPRPEHAHKILALAGKKLKLEDIYPKQATNG